MDTRELLLKSDRCHSLEAIYGNLNACLQDMALGASEIGRLMAEDCIIDSICEKMTGKTFSGWLEEPPDPSVEPLLPRQSSQCSYHHPVLI